MPATAEAERGGARPTCSHGAFAGQAQKAFLFQNEAPSDEDAGAHSQAQADAEVILPSPRAHRACDGRGARESHGSQDGDAGAGGEEAVFQSARGKTRSSRNDQHSSCATQTEPHFPSHRGSPVLQCQGKQCPQCLEDGTTIYSHWRPDAWNLHEFFPCCPRRLPPLHPGFPPAAELGGPENRVVGTTSELEGGGMGDGSK